jgi:hypothetical protein
LLNDGTGFLSGACCRAAAEAVSRASAIITTARPSYVTSGVTDLAAPTIFLVDFGLEPGLSSRLSSQSKMFKSIPAPR